MEYNSEAERPILRSAGFLSPQKALPKLSRDFEPLELSATQMPRLLRSASLATTIEALPLLDAYSIPESSLSRAAIILSSLAHGFGYEKCRSGPSGHNKPIELPDTLLSLWEIVSCRLGRGLPRRTIEDDLLNNCSITNDNGPQLLLPYFDIPEEHMSAGLQVLMEHRFGGVLKAMMDIQDHVSRFAPNFILARSFSAISRGLVDCIQSFCEISIASFDGPRHFDPVIWGKTYPEIGRPITPGESPNSGVNSPLFHAIDSFIGLAERGAGVELYRQQVKRRGLLPAQIQELIQNLEETSRKVKTRIESNPEPLIAKSFEAVLQMYWWLLERHRMRAVGMTPIVLASGRMQTAGGVPRLSGHPPEDMLNEQLYRAMIARFGLGPRIFTVEVESKTLVGSSTACLTLTVPCPLPLKPGDTIQIWPQIVDADCNPQQGSIGQRLFPRYYSVALVAENANQSTRVLLTIALGSGSTGEFLCTLPSKVFLGARLVPRPEFQLPVDHSSPLLLIAQGAGVGPFMGFLAERYQLSESKGQPGEIILIVGAKRLDSVPYLPALISFAKKLRLEIHLAVSDGHSCVIRGDSVQGYGDAIKASEVLSGSSKSIRNRIINPRGHVFVSGSGAFGEDVRNTLEILGLLPPDHRCYHDACRGGIPRIPIPDRQVAIEELAQHNSPSSLWTAIDNIVYDLTKFAGYHPGGFKTLMEVAGTVADHRFLQVHSSETNQGLLNRVRPYAVGRLEQCGQTVERMRMLRLIVKRQNALTNSTTFGPGRIVPFYIFSDSLFVCIDSFDVIARSIRDAGLGSVLLARLEETFLLLNDACWAYLAAGADTMLEEREEKVQRVYAVYWEMCHSIFEKIKRLCCGPEAGASEENFGARILRCLEFNLEELAMTAGPLHLD
ncbi:hypothetical protein GQ53DRAFT_824392 [Thozetella sp. PMI_491]|nr:hypothetical protein GQ53DRAFT_824392 [Thozetella sp. PMI_491]